jgi:ketosteroid isomerase-like protein
MHPPDETIAPVNACLLMASGTRWLSGPPGGRAGGGGFDQVRFRYRIVAEPGLDRSGESVGGELCDDLMVGPGEVRVGGAGDDRQAAVGEMAPHGAISPQEAADRLAIRELVDAYAHCADRRDAKGQMALFTEDTRFLVFYDLTSAEPSQELHGRESLAPVFDDLNQYVATMHFNGQSTVALDGDRATGESYCLAHHLKVSQDKQRTLMVASIRYLDEFVKQDGQWFFAERRLMVNWIDTRPSAA